MTERLRQTIVIVGSTADVIYGEGDVGGPEDRSVFTLTTEGSEIRFVRSCPRSTDVHRIAYTATPTEVRIADGDDGENVYTRQ